jgi:hypothetical protein
MKIFAYSKWDAVAVLAGVQHFGYVLTFFFVFPYAPWWPLICMGLLYSVSVSWNINGVSHNLIHNPFFKSRILNRLFGIMESVTLVSLKPSTNMSITGTTPAIATDRTNTGTPMTGFQFTALGMTDSQKTRGDTFS